MSNLKEQEQSDLYIALTHLGIYEYSDYFLAINTCILLITVSIN